ncbi:RsmE family RNA methyltransferase [Sulfoacidibacillus thermotolerans]|uniref:Ribosomal RNA small subunit methyltransferase E n=1 Tax=Sulfoacidibacillus thermotolerans TaxID=1765684 RepID=A0A2U3D7A1_SULT2|nr:RsmE family RNA methyltransferase [Sulfoacidibacillus thermotolerans]PWI57170.1 hypothetical protein BM613_09885 [Sulfoacidibacillus thermotolerans]
MQRYFISDDVTEHLGHVSITGDDVHHIAHVMRMMPGMYVEVGYRGVVYQAQITEMLTDRVMVKLMQPVQLQDPSVKLTLYQALPKGDKIDLVIRQACEIGVSRIVIFEGERSVAKVVTEKRDARLLRWRKIAKEAAEQAKRAKVPDVFFVPEITDIFIDGKPEWLLVPYELQEERLPTLKSVLKTHVHAKEQFEVSAIGFVIGPEGGFSSAEISWLHAQGGHLLTLGPRILRTETAGIVVATIVLYELNQMGVT